MLPPPLRGTGKSIRATRRGSSVRFRGSNGKVVIALARAGASWREVRLRRERLGISLNPSGKLSKGSVSRSPTRRRVAQPARLPCPDAEGGRRIARSFRAAERRTSRCPMRPRVCALRWKRSAFKGKGTRLRCRRTATKKTGKVKRRENNKELCGALCCAPRRRARGLASILQTMRRQCRSPGRSHTTTSTSQSARPRT